MSALPARLYTPPSTPAGTREPHTSLDIEELFQSPGHVVRLPESVQPAVSHPEGLVESKNSNRVAAVHFAL